MNALLRIEGVVAGYGRGDILRGIDLGLEDGTVTCLVGPNGAGKSTVLKVLSGLLRDHEVTLPLGWQRPAINAYVTLRPRGGLRLLVRPV